MPTQEDIAEQKELLQAHRQTLDILLDQQTSFTPRYTPPSVVNGIIEARREIARIKQTLRDWGVEVVDRAIDTERPIDRIKRKILSIPTLPLVLGLIAVVLGGIAAVWVSVVPAKMTDGDFNVAVAEFGQVDGQGRVTPTDDSKRISRTLFTTLQYRFENMASADKRPVVWHDSMNILQKRVTIGTIAGDQADACQNRASDLNADIIVYGTLDARATPAQLSLQFCTRSRPTNRNRDTGHFQELKGVDRLGSPIDISLPISENADNPMIQARADLLARLSMGLNSELGNANDFQSSLRRALRQFEDTQKNLELSGVVTNTSLNMNGGDVVYYFIGREHFLLFQDPDTPESEKIERLEQARLAFLRATEINSSYARAWTGLGSVYFLKARQAIFEQRSAADELARSIDAYQKAITSSHNAGETSAEAEAHLTLAETYWLQADWLLRQAPPDNAASLVSLQQAEQWAESGEALVRPDQNRFLGYAAMVRGLIAHWRAQISQRSGDPSSARAQFQLASGLYQKCIDAGAKDPDDQFLKRQIVDATCRVKAGNIQAALQNLQGAGERTLPAATPAEPAATSVALAPTAAPTNAPTLAPNTPEPPTNTLAPPTNTPAPPTTTPVPPTDTPVPPTDTPAPPTPTLEPPDANTIPNDNREYDDDLDAYDVTANDPAVGRDNGDGIESVTFQFFGPDGQEVFKQVEHNPRYCSFGGGDNDQNCDGWRFSEHNNQWPNGAPVQYGRHKLFITIQASRGGVATDQRSFTLLQPDAQPLVADIGPTNGIFGDQLSFQVSAFDPNVGNANGAGIANVTFQIFDDQDHLVHERTERNVLYCAFGGGDNGQPCDVWRFSEHNGQWSRGDAVRNGATYTVRATIMANSGQQSQQELSFIIQR